MIRYANDVGDPLLAIASHNNQPEQGEHVPIELEKLMLEDEWERIGVNALTEDQQQALSDWGMRMYSLGQHVVEDVDEVKYAGRLVVLCDGTRWEVDETDSHTAELWGPMDKVVVIDDQMFKLDDAESVSVEEDLG